MFDFVCVPFFGVKNLVTSFSERETSKESIIGQESPRGVRNTLPMKLFAVISPHF